ncbi:MAG: class I SAM-dependent methyltransferase [Planctomycetota bacterium]
MKLLPTLRRRLATWLLRRPSDAAAVALPLDAIANRPWFSSPFGTTPRAPAERYEQLAAEARAKDYPAVDAWESAAGFAIDRDWFHDLARLTQIVIKTSELCYQHGRLLYSAVRRRIAADSLRHLNILESGTARGFSSLCMARALADAGASGTIITFDVLPHRVPMLWNCVRDLDGPCTRAELLAAYADLVERYVVFHQGDTRLEMPKVKPGRVHVAFLDGAHTYDDVMIEFGCVREAQAPGDVVFFDDYTADFPGVVQAVDEITSRQGYRRELIEAGPRRYVCATRER